MIGTKQATRFGRAALAVLAATTLAVVALTPTLEAGSIDRRVFAFDRLNRVYEMDDSRMQPIEQGPVTIHLASPRNSLILKDHSVALTPLGDGTHEASIVLDFLGSGDLIADFDTGTGTPSRLDDLVIVPRQKIRIDGRVRFSSAEGGWDIRALRIPKVVRIDIQSRLAGNLVTMCGSMGVFLGLDCDGLDRSLSRVEVPMPEAGSVFFLPRTELTDGEARALDAFLGRP